MQVFAPRLRDRQTSGSHVGFAGYDVWNDLRDAVDGPDNELDAEFAGEFTYQVEFGTGWPVGTLDVADRAVTRDYAQLAEFEHLVQERWWRRTGAE